MRRGLFFRSPRQEQAPRSHKLTLGKRLAQRNAGTNQANREKRAEASRVCSFRSMHLSTTDERGRFSCNSKKQSQPTALRCINTPIRAFPFRHIRARIYILRAVATVGVNRKKFR